MRLDRNFLIEKEAIKISTLNAKLKDTLSNVKILGKKNGEKLSVNDVVAKDESLRATCKNCNDKTFVVTANELDTMKKLKDQTTGKLNPCEKENAALKDFNKLPEEKKQEILKKRAAGQQVSSEETGKYGGRFDSKEEAYVYKIIKNYISKNQSTFAGCKLYPEGYGKKKRLEFTNENGETSSIKRLNRDGSTTNNKTLDADIFIEFPVEVADYFEKTLGHRVEGHMFMIDGPTHYGTSVKYSVFSADQARALSNRYFVTRIETRSMGKDFEPDSNIDSNESNEFRNIIQYVSSAVKKTGAALINARKKMGEKIGFSHDVSRAEGTQVSAKSVSHTDAKKKKDNQIERIITNLKNREHTTPYRDKADFYVSTNKNIDIEDLSPNEFGAKAFEYIKKTKGVLPDRTEDFINDVIGKNEKAGITRKLSQFLRTTKGRVSYAKFPAKWGQVVDMTEKQLEAWKRQYQAKDGEKLFDKNNLKLFENEKDR